MFSVYQNGEEESKRQGQRGKKFFHDLTPCDIVTPDIQVSALENRVYEWLRTCWDLELGRSPEATLSLKKGGDGVSV
jgi:hypothetical protein